MNGCAERARERDVLAGDPAFVRQFENPLGARVDRLVNRMPKARDFPPGRVNLLDDLSRRATGGVRILEQTRAELGCAEDDRAGAEDPRREGTLQRAGVGSERHPRGDIGRHHPVLGDADQQQIEEKALVLGRLTAGEQQVEVLGEAQPAHQVAAEIASPHFDPVGIGLGDVGH